MQIEWVAFLVPLMLGFVFNLASAFTTTFSRWWGKQRGTLITALLRNVLGIPVWGFGFFLAARTPSPALFVPTIVITTIGWLIIAAGGVIIIVALVEIRLRSLMPSTQDALAQNGLYAYVRHPIHTGTLLEFIGLFIVTPTQAVTLACVLGIAWVLVQTKLEEYDLLQRLPAYRDYMDRVPCFLPSLWTK